MSARPLGVPARLRALRSPFARSARLELLAPEPGQMAELVPLINDRSVARGTLRIPFPYTMQDAVAYYRRARRPWRTGTGLSLSVVRRRDRRLLGGVGLHKVDAENRSAEVGYWLGRPFRHEGYATEALRLLARLAFEQVGLHRLEARIFVGNAASERVALAGGFRFEGRLRGEVRKDGRWRDVLLYARLREDRASSRSAGAGASRRRGSSATPTR